LGTTAQGRERVPTGRGGPLPTEKPAWGKKGGELFTVPVKRKQTNISNAIWYLKGTPEERGQIHARSYLKGENSPNPPKPSQINAAQSCRLETRKTKPGQPTPSEAVLKRPKGQKVKGSSCKVPTTAKGGEGEKDTTWPGQA